MENHMQELKELLEGKEEIIRNKNRYIKEYSFFRHTLKFSETLGSAAGIPMPKILEITVKGYIKIADMIDEQFAAIITQVDEEIAKYQTTKQA